MHGDAVHQKAIELKQSGAIHASGLTMHFVTKEFDQGPIIFEYALPIIGDSWEALKKVINPLEHYFQPWVLNHVVHGRVSWDGKNPSSLKFPADYWRPPICE